jgi:hypothetical protein
VDTTRGSMKALTVAELREQLADKNAADIVWIDDADTNWLLGLQTVEVVDNDGKTGVVLRGNYYDDEANGVV